MSNIQNLKETANPYSYSSPGKMNFSLEGNDSRVQSFSSSKISNSGVILKQDEILRNGVHKRSLGKKISIDFMSDNEFMTSFQNDVKEIATSGMNSNNHSEGLQFVQRNKKSKYTILSSLSSATDNSFLLDSQTYKNICEQQNSKKSQLANLLSSSASMNTSTINKCHIHDSPFEIVCIQDRSLICSHCGIFGEHRTHSLAPLKKIEEFIRLKREQVNDIIADYQSLQLGIKQKTFMSEFSHKLHQKKKQASSSITQTFKSIREFLVQYQRQLMDEVQKLYSCLEGNISEAIKRVSLDANKAAFERWRQDALGVVEQLGYRDMNKASQVSLFLSNFRVPTDISNCTPSKHCLQTVSLQSQGKQYLSQIQQQLILNINQVMKISNKFKFDFIPDYKEKIKSFFSFEADSQLELLMQENKLETIMGQLRNGQQASSKVGHEGKAIGRTTSNSKNLTSSGHIRNSFSHFNKQQPILIKHKQPQLSSTINTTTQSIPFINMVKNSKMVSTKNGVSNSSKNQQEKHHEEVLNGQGKLPLKFKKREQTYGNEEIRRTETSVRSIDLPLNVMESKSFCLDPDRRRKVSPSPKNMVGVRNDHFFASPTTARLNRGSSRQQANIYGANLKEQQTLRESKLKTQQTLSEDPLKIIENYEQTETQNFDLSNCQLNDTEIIYFVQKASKIRKIKHLKLAGNQLTDAGLQKILLYLPNCNLMNLSNNKLSQNTIDLLLKKREKIQQLKMVNLSNNKLNERKIKQKISEFKRMGIVVTL